MLLELMCDFHLSERNTGLYLNVPILKPSLTMKNEYFTTTGTQEIMKPAKLTILNCTKV